MITNNIYYLAAVWPDLAKFLHLGKIFKVLVNFWGFIYYFGKLWTDFGKILYVIGQIFIDVNGQMLKNNLAIWWHCLAVDFDEV